MSFHALADTEGAMPLPHWHVPSCDEALKEFAGTFTEAEKTEAWARTTETVKKYSDEMIERWNAELDTGLVYAALFSAILTAFNVQSYPLLEPSTRSDPTLALLQQISAQLNSYTINSPYVNATQQASGLHDAPPSVIAPPLSSVALNALWFSSLVVSLSAASVAITIKQWLHEYRTGISGNSLEIARLRQYRLDKLLKWHVAEIVAFIPVLLQLSLVLFFAGLVILLWTLHVLVAVIVTALIGVVFVFMVGTTLLPIWRRDCCYLSPPTYFFYTTVQAARHAYEVFLRVPTVQRLSRLFSRISSAPALPSFIRTLFVKLHTQISRRRPYPKARFTWRAQEQHSVSSSPATLIVRMVVTAYTYNIDGEYLSNTAALHLADLDPALVLPCLEEVHAANVRHFGAKPYAWVPRAPVDFWVGTFIHVLYQSEHYFRGRGNDRHPQLSTPLKYIEGAGLHRDPSPARYHRLLLALATAESLYRRLTLKVLETLFCGPASNLSVLPWPGVRHVLAAMESWVPDRVRRPEGDTFDEEDEGKYVLTAIDILLRCCTSDVPQWEDARTEDESQAVVACSRRAVSRLVEHLPTTLAIPFSYAMAEKLVSILQVLCANAAGQGLVDESLISVLDHLVSSLMDDPLWVGPSYDELSPLAEAVDKCKAIHIPKHPTAETGADTNLAHV